MANLKNSSPNLDERISAAQRGDQAAFEAVFEHSYDTLYRYAFKWAGNPVDAEDIAQLAAIKLAKTLKQFRFESQFSTWLYRLVVNTAIDWQRANQRHNQNQPVSDEYNHPSSPNPADAVTSEHEGFNAVYLQQLINRVAQLGDGFREAVVLVLGEGFSHKEAAEVLNIKESTVSWRIHEVRKFLKQTTGGCHE